MALTNNQSGNLAAAGTNSNTPDGRPGGTGAPGGPPGGNGEKAPPLANWAVVCIAAYFVVIYGGLVLMQYVLWTSYAEKGPITAYVLWFKPFDLSVDAWYLYLVLSVGALGSFVHAATSLSDFVGNRQTAASWALWFVLRPFIGSALALVFYLVLRGGLLSASTPTHSLNVYGFAGIAALTGMFAKQAADKLGEVFDTLFNTAKKRNDPLVKDATDVASKGANDKKGNNKAGNNES